MFVHMFSVFFMKAYRKPREFGWWSGMALLLADDALRLQRLSAADGRTGLLRHQGRAGDSRRRCRSSGRTSPTWCAAGRRWASSRCSGSSRCMWWCCRRLFMPLLGFHLWLVQKHGNAVPPSEEAKPPSERQDDSVLPELPGRRTWRCG